MKFVPLLDIHMTEIIGVYPVSAGFRECARACACVHTYVREGVRTYMSVCM